jgi:hypothetical protein
MQDAADLNQGKASPLSVGKCLTDELFSAFPRDLCSALSTSGKSKTAGHSWCGLDC